VILANGATNSNPKIVTVAQMVAIEQASERNGVSVDTLMENAGLAVAMAGRRLIGGVVADVSVLVLVGPGNNGADGLVAARHLLRWGARVTAYLVRNRPSPDPKMALAAEYQIQVATCADDPELSQLEVLLGRSRLVIDGVLGTGNSRPLEGVVKEVMLRLCHRRNRPAPPKLLALDLPSGLNADTGAVDEACPVVDLTVALGRPKIGLLTFPGAANVGDLEIVDIGIPPDLKEDKQINLELITPGWVAHRLPSRPLDSHKGTFGHALVVAGSRNYAGAAFLASQAAVRVGAGLVTLASPSGVYPIAASKLTEVIHLPLPEDSDGRVTAAGAGLIASLVEEGPRRYNAMLVGCGLGWSEGTTDFMERLLLNPPVLNPPDSEPSTNTPVIIDADGLNNLSKLPDWWSRLNRPTAVTPHPGEMSTLTGIATAELQKDRAASVRHWSSLWGATVALKGAFTAVAEPAGLVRVSPFSNPGLASGGTGDVLSGIIAGLMAQGLSPNDATCCGVFIHGDAAERVRRRIGESGMVASDLLEALPKTLSSLRQLRVG